MKLASFIVFLIFVFSTSVGVTLSPNRPELMIFVSPDKKMELHSPIRKNSILIKKKLIFKEKVNWPNNMNVLFLFSDPTSSRLFTIGGLGDSGSDLGVISFYNLEGNKTSLQVSDILPDLEELSKSYRDLSNFPWISAIDITDQELLIWVCDKALVKVEFKNLKMQVVAIDSEPKWIKDSKNNVVSQNAVKYRWHLKPKYSF